MSNENVDRKSEYPSPATAWLFVFILMIAYAFAFVDRMAIGLVIDPIRQDLHLTDTQVSLLVGFAFIICFVIFSLPFGQWVDRYRRCDVIAFGVAFWSLAMIASGAAMGFWQLFASRVGVGIGEACLNPAAYSAVPDCFPPRRRALAMSVYAAGAAIGGGSGIYIGSLVLQWAMATRPVLPFIGQPPAWKVLFICLGLPGLLIAALIYLFIREPKRHGDSEFDKSSVSVKEASAYLYARRGVFLPTFIGFSGFAINNYAFTVWGPAYFLRVHHLHTSQVGLLFGLGFGVGGVLGMILGGLWSDYELARGKPEAPIWVALRAAWIELPFFVGAYLCKDIHFAAPLFVIAMISASLVGGLQGSMIQVLTPNRLRGQVGAIFLVIVNALGLGVAPTVTAAMTDYVFGGPTEIGKSLAATTIIALSMTTAFLLWGMPRVREQARSVTQ